MYCPNCGASLPGHALICSRCGESIHLLEPHSNQDKNIQDNNTQENDIQYSNNQHIESPYEMTRLPKAKAPNRKLFEMIGIIVIAIIILSAIIILALEGKNEKSDMTYTKETYREEAQPEKVLEQDIYEEEGFIEETEKGIDGLSSELTVHDIEGQWQVRLYDDGEYSHKEEWIWIVTPIDDTNFIINFPPDELFDEELDTEGIEGIEDVTITARLEKNILYVKFPTDDTISVRLAMKNGKLQGEGKLIIGDPEGDVTVTLEMLKDN
ncbi:zinc ribbon domain-containing protein [Cellulosilyticum sp. I15G10I2]|uniref:zinc ribbon domain-containing protein n=1 Tax=Cellulosilyticum sp. I15G10I2 TaxID=1892843 RepID=UPI00085C4FAD|nr:zinc ribbon domain-containing protein [Cellulosilyticum sp. I15G10I2]